MQKFIDIVEEATRPEPNNFYSNISTHYICYKKYISHSDNEISMKIFINYFGDHCSLTLHIVQLARLTRKQ